MPYRKRRRRRRRRTRKASVKQVKAIVKKEVGKTRETNKMVSYVGWSRLNDILLSNLPASPNLPEPHDTVCCYSLTGGLSSTIDSTQAPNNYICKELFTLLPTNENAGNQAGVGQAQQGGTAGQQDASGGAGAAAFTEAIANIYQLEGRQCYLKKFYASVALNNSQTSVDTPTNVFIRAVVIETRRPLSSTQLGKQVLLQNHSTIEMSPGATTTNNYPCSAMGYLNRDVIKKVHYDKIFTLNGGGGATGSLKRFKIQVPINKKARWSYYYPSGVPADRDNTLTYQGPFLYLIMWASSSSTFDSDFALPAAGNEGGGIASIRRPAFALSSILTFMDD